MSYILHVTLRSRVVTSNNTPEIQPYKYKLPDVHISDTSETQVCQV